MKNYSNIFLRAQLCIAPIYCARPLVSLPRHPCPLCVQWIRMNHFQIFDSDITFRIIKKSWKAKLAFIQSSNYRSHPMYSALKLLHLIDADGGDLVRPWIPLRLAYPTRNRYNASDQNAEGHFYRLRFPFHVTSKTHSL